MPDLPLLHPVRVTIQQISEADSVYDDDYREPVQQVARSANVILLAQVVMTGDQVLLPNLRGKDLDTLGYCIFRNTDMIRKSVTLKVGDRIIRLGGVDTDIYITALTSQGHWADINRAAYLRADFKSREPVEHNRGRL